MNPAAFTLKNNRTALVIYGATLLFGAATFLSISRLEYPEFTIRNAQIITQYPGRTTVQVEQEVTEPIEQKLRQMPEMLEIKSTSKPGLSIITVEIRDEFFDMEDIWTDMRNRISEVRLPQGAQEPTVNDDFGDVFPYIYALTSDGFSYREMLDHAEDIRDALLAIDGVGKVEFHGEQEERIYLEFSSSEVAAYGASPTRIAGVINNQNAVSTSGDVQFGPERINLITLGEFENLDELKSYRLTIPGEATSVQVSDLFNVQRSYQDPPRSITHFNGERVICIAVSMLDGGVVTKIGDAIEMKLAALQQELPVGLDIESMFFQPEYVAKSVNDFVVNLGQAFFFVVIVMLLFAGWRISIIVGILVPSAILIAFALMPSLGIALETMSIAALIIALGLLVDNAVVVSEQILVRLNAGQSRFEAVTESVRTLTIPLLAASGTTIAAFSTIALASGQTAEFTYSLFAVVSLTLLGSWILSITIIPLFSFYFLKELKRDTLIGRGLNRLYDPYERMLRFLLKLKWAYPILILVLTLGAGMLFGKVPSIFFPPNERGQFVIEFELPLGTDISETEARVAELESYLLSEERDQIRRVSTWIGDGGPRWYLSLSPEPPNSGYAFFSVLTHSNDPKSIQRMINRIHQFAENQDPNVRVVARTLENGPPVGDPIQIRLYGPDMETLYKLRDEIIPEVEAVPGMFDVRDSWGSWVKQISVDPDPVRSVRLGLTTNSISESLNLQFSGLNFSTFQEDEEAIPMVMRSKEDFRENPDRIADLPIFISSGTVPLGQVADTSVDFLPGSIKREDTIRMMTIKGRVRDRFSSEALAEVQPRIAKLVEGENWPIGYWIEYGGEQEESAKSQKSIGSAMPISLTILSLILIGQFNSLRRFAIILLTIPPMLIGVVPGLLITGSSFGFMTLLGMIALLGIIVNNAILLIDETDHQIDEGLELEEAIVEAAKSRLRPIIMTTITTIIGLLPLAISGGGMWSSMAYAMMFGLGFATLLTLALCPVLFFLFFNQKEKTA
tara:strand:+ start:364 stop:3414 length:3051 start_codon:yes stop_codon:yes gene_type:complete